MEANRFRVNHGGVTQLGECHNGIVKVRGSNPLISTKQNRQSAMVVCFVVPLPHAYND